MPPRGRPSGSHSSRPSSSRSSHSSRPSSSHSSRPSSSHSSRPAHRSSPPRHSSFGGGPQHPSGFGGPPPPPRRHTPRYHPRGTYPAGSGCSGCGRPRLFPCGCISSFVLVAVIIAAAISFGNRGTKEDTRSNQSQNTGWQQSAESHEAIFVSALNRDVPWSNEYDCYYDQQTDCYFLLNTDVDPPIWQYWYEGISSQYGDYGWMEWDAKEQHWYVESGQDKWERLPEKYESDLWHFD